MDGATNVARRVLTEYRNVLDVVAQRLIRDETIDGQTFESLFGEIERPHPAGALAPVTVAA